MRLRTIIILISLVVFVGLLGYQIELTLPGRAPSLNNTYTPLTKSAPRGVGSYDVLGYAVSKEEADKLLQSERGREALSADNSAVKITEELIDLGRNTFYQETFGNEYLFTDIVGILDGPINLGSISKAVLALKGKPTTNLQIPIDQDITVGSRTFKAGTPDPEASLRVLLDRNLREPTVAANRANPDLQRSNVDGSGHAYWVDEQAGFTTQDQSDLIQFLLSIDDHPEVLPNTSHS